MNSTSEQILDVAQALIVGGGYNGFSYADIADAVGIRKASIHHHFPTKAELVAALVDRYRQQTASGLKALQAQSPGPADQLRSYVNFWQTCIQDATLPVCVCAMLAGEMPMLPEEVAARVRAHFHDLAGWLTSVLQAGAAAAPVPTGQAAGRRGPDADGISPWSDALRAGVQRSRNVCRNRHAADR